MDAKSIQDAAVRGDVDTFLQAMDLFRQSQDRHLVYVLNETVDLFNRRVPNLFGATDPEELQAAYRESMAVWENKPRGIIAREAATPPVVELAETGSKRHPLSKDVESEVYKLLYQVKCLLRDR